MHHQISQQKTPYQLHMVSDHMSSTNIGMTSNKQILCHTCHDRILKESQGLASQDQYNRIENTGGPLSSEILTVSHL